MAKSHQHDAFQHIPKAQLKRKPKIITHRSMLPGSQERAVEVQSAFVSDIPPCVRDILPEQHVCAMSEYKSLWEDIQPSQTASYTDESGGSEHDFEDQVFDRYFAAYKSLSSDPRRRKPREDLIVWCCGLGLDAKISEDRARDIRIVGKALDGHFNN